MYNYILHFFARNKQNIYLNKDYTKGYQNAWIKNIRDYSP